MTTLRRIAFLIALLLPASSPAYGAPRVRDTWHSFIADGQRYGYEHIVVARLPDGNYRITTETRLKLDVLGLQKEELSERAEYVVTPDYHPVSIASEGKRGSGATKVAAGRRGESLQVTATVAGVERSHTFERADAILTAACLDDWLADRPRDYQQGEIAVLDEESCALRKATVKRITQTEPGSSWSVDMGDGPQRILLDADGLRREFSVANGMLVSRRSLAEQARETTFRKIDGRDALMFPIDREIGTLDRLESLSVELRWKDIGFDRFRLEDDRQHIVEKSRDGQRYRVVVRIEPPAPLTNPAMLPISGQEFAADLGESRYIKPHDPKIIAVAREVTRGKTDALEAVKALSTWVSKNIDVAYISETLSGPEVLACRKGKCSEFATLFASLARAAGIPTRIVLGDRIITGQWGGHMWNEVYVGRWIPVDAGYNEIGKTSALLKFLDDDSVEGVLPLRLALPASLEIRIIDHRSTPAPLAKRFKTGIDGRVYTSAELGCRLTAPGGGWSIEPKTEAGAVMMRFKLAGKDDVQVHFVAFALPGSIEPKLLIGLRRKRYESKLKGLEFHDDSACTVKGLPGHRLVFRHLSEKGKPRRADEVVWRKAGSGFLLALSVEEADYEQVKPAFTALLESFEDLERK